MHSHRENQPKQTNKMEIHSVALCVGFFCILSMIWYLRSKTQAIVKWPIVGTLPSLLWNSNRLSLWTTEVFSSLGGKGSFFIDGGVISNFSFVVTCHPKNLEYILKTNFTNFPKGSDFKEVFDILGDGIFSVDNDSWRLQRKLAHASFASAEFRYFINKAIKKVVEYQLIPLLMHVVKQDSIVDLQDWCKRLTFDSAMRTIFGREENYLSMDLSVNEIADAVDDAQEAIFYRVGMPTFLWKLLRFLRVGTEKKLAKAWKTSDLVLEEYISLTRKNLLEGIETTDLLSTYLKSGDKFMKDDKFIRDTMLSLFLGARDTIASGLTWFLWLVARTPRVEAKILEELKLVITKKNETKDDCDLETTTPPYVFDSDDLKDLVYLHAAICESLRLYPPLPLNKEDILPDGTSVKPGQQILLAFYSEGRMPWVWGVDSLEFKPERWIDDKGKLSHEPFANFFAFNAGPRTCLGQNMSFTQMKVVIAAILFNFHVELVEDHPVDPKPSITLFMMNGFLVKVRERMGV